MMKGVTMSKSGKVQLIIAAVFVLIGAVLLILSQFGIGMRFSGVLCFGIAVLLLLSVALEALANKHPGFRWLRRLFCVGLAAGALVFCVLEGQVIRAARSVPEAADAAIVLGAGVRGTVPSLSLQCRLDAALAYAEQYPEIPVVLSGGQGSGEQISEAECMRRYLTEHGVSEERLLLEDRSESTEENLRFSKQILTEHGFSAEEMTIAVISNDFHLCRAELLAEREGLTVTGVGAPIPWLHLEVNYTVREAFALAKTYLIG